MTGRHQVNRDDCYICGRGNPDLLEQHRIVPSRHGGKDYSENLVELCPTCRKALTNLYDERFYRALGVESEIEDDRDPEDEVDEEVGSQEASRRDRIRALKGIIEELDEGGMDEPGAPHTDVVDEAVLRGWKRERITAEMEKLRRQGDIYQPEEGRWRVL